MKSEYTVDRNELAKLVSALKPGISTKDLVPIPGCLCIDEGTAATHDDMVTCISKCDALADFSGGFPLGALDKWLSKQTGASIKIRPDDTSVRFSCSRSYVKLPLYTPEYFTWDVPDTPGRLKVTPELWAAFKAVSECQGIDAHQDWALGVTLVFHVGAVEIYATDNYTCAHANVSMEVPKKLQGKAYTVPPRWVTLAASSAPTRLVFGESAIGLRTSDGTWIYGALVGDSNPAAHERVFDRFNWARRMIPVSRELLSDLAVAESYYSDDAKADMALEDGRLSIKVTAPAGELSSTYDVDLEDKRRESASFMPNLLRRVLAHSSGFAVDVDAFICVGDGLRFLAPVLRGDG